LARSLLAENEHTPDATAALRVDLASILLMAGNVDDAIAAVEAVVGQPGLSSSQYAAAETTRLLALLAGGNYAGARGPAESILSGERNHGDDAALAAALTALSMIAWHEGHIADALSLMRGAVGRAQPAPAHEVRTLARFALGCMLVAVGEDEAGYETVDEVDAEPSPGTPWSILTMLFRSRVHLACGRLDAAAREIERAEAVAEEHGTSFLAPLVGSVGASVALLRGETARAGRIVARAPGRAGAGRLAWIEARVLEATSASRREALDLLEPVYDDVPANRAFFIEEPGAAAWLVRAALAEGKVRRAHRIAVGAEQLAADNREFDCISAIASHARGVLEREPDALRQAAATHWQPWARASAAEDAAVVLTELGRKNEARVEFDRALADYEIAGSGHDAERVRTRLAANGRERTRDTRPAQGWESLTPGELRVVALVAEGLTNRQAADRAFLSRHTVDFHLRQAFRKLGITSRVELVRVVLEHEQHHE
jgi:DNA-binding CsgD family transcriptional regulator